MVFCNNCYDNILDNEYGVTILILIDGFLQFKQEIKNKEDKTVTILILIDGFLQLIIGTIKIVANGKSQSLF